jgi:hypothetical protein
MRSGMGLRGGCWGCVTDSQQSNQVSLTATGRRFLIQMSDERDSSESCLEGEFCCMSTDCLNSLWYNEIFWEG